MINLQRISSRARLELSNGSVPFCSGCFRRLYSKSIVRENDVVLVKKKSDSRAGPILSKPLVPGGKIADLEPRSRDSIDANDIIGKGIRDLVKSKKGTDYRIYEPTLAEYTNLSSRLVTPIYPQDANLIVSLLDLHPTTPGSKNDIKGERFEIFEAGTGHGALTLHLSRAIHGANTPAPELPPAPSPTDRSKKVSYSLWESLAGLVVKNKVDDPYETWRANRRAVIHTLDISPEHSAHAQNVVRNFRHGMYFPHIDFHVGKLEDYLSSRLESNGDEPFLAHAILDLPDTHHYLEIVGKALNPNGCLITWNPSITQTIRCVEVVREKRLPFLLEKVLEVGTSVGVGGKEWDVRSVKPRARVKAEALAKQKAADSQGKESQEIAEGGLGAYPEAEQHDMDSTGAVNTAESKAELTAASDDSGWEMVCRPKVGLRIEGGGFIGLWRRMEQY